jgi:hypothetical protein
MTTSLVTTGRKRSRDSNRSDSSDIIVNPLDVAEGDDLIAARLEVGADFLTYTREPSGAQRSFSIRRTRRRVGPGRRRKGADARSGRAS